MGYYMRFLCTDSQGLTLQELETGLRSVNPAYSLVIEMRGTSPGRGGLLKLGDVEIADIEVNRPGDGLFEEEIKELDEFITDMSGNRKRFVRKALKDTRLTFAFQVLFQGREVTDVFKDLDPVWDWLFANRGGVLQVDDDGYYDGTGKLLRE